jgi:ABC-type uncharacterized transport system ATPase subunit
MTHAKSALEAVKISKHFGDFCALNKVSLTLRHKSFHALLGENGAGKSTLVKCIMGYYHPDDGEVLFADKQHAIANPHQAHMLGLGMVYQHFTLIPNMTVAENLVLARPQLPAVINWRAELKQLTDRMASMPFQVDLNASINSLSAGEKQKVEIIKQLLLDIKVLILDEPTSVLTPNEADEVLTKVKDMTQSQDLSVIIITHKFREVMNYADEVTVLRKGELIATENVDTVTSEQLANMMVGREVTKKQLQRGTTETTGAILCIDDICVQDDTGLPAVANLSLEVNSGEIVGIAGVSGNGQKELVQVLAGQRQFNSGEVKVNGHPYHAKRQQMRLHKFHCLPEEPLRNACVPAMSIADNLAFRRFDRPPFAFKNWILNRAAFKSAAKELINRFSIRTWGPENPVGNLSGGNVQRTVLARELSEEVNALVVVNPCFGLDFNAVADIREQIMQARNRGTAVLLVSEDLDEILELSDRFLVISEGKLVYETTPQNADLTVVGQHMAGH